MGRVILVYCSLQGGATAPDSGHLSMAICVCGVVGRNDSPSRAIMTQKVEISTQWMLDCPSVDLFVIGGPLHHRLGCRSLSLVSRRILYTAKDTFLGACHEIYVRLIALYHRTQDISRKHAEKASTRCSITKLPFFVDNCVKRAMTMTTTLQKQAWQSGLVLLDETPEWNFEDWPPLAGGWRYYHASVVLDHPDNKTEQTVVVLGGYRTGYGEVNSILVLNLADPDKQWREGPPMNKSRRGHAAVLCNGGVYVMGGRNTATLDCIERIDANDILQPFLTASTTHEIHGAVYAMGGRTGGYRDGANLDCIEQIDANDLLQSSLTTTSITHESHWTTLTCRLSTRRFGCCAVVVQNRYIVVMGGYNGRYLSSVDIIDTSNDTVTAGPSMTVPRQWCASAVIGHRIFVVGGHGEHGFLDTVKYLDYATPCDNHETKKETGSTFISFSTTWITHSELRLSNAQSSCAIIAVGSCLVVAGGQGHSTVEVLDTRHNRVWNLPPLDNHRDDCSTVTVANQVAVISGWGSPTCATLPLLDKHTWCFQRLFDQQLNIWCLFREGRNIQHADNSPFPTWTSDRKRARPHTHRGDEGKDGT